MSAVSIAVSIASLVTSSVPTAREVVLSARLPRRSSAQAVITHIQKATDEDAKEGEEARRKRCAHFMTRASGGLEQRLWRVPIWVCR
jgi:hypothetical protein